MTITHAPAPFPRSRRTRTASPPDTSRLALDHPITSVLDANPDGPTVHRVPVLTANDSLADNRETCSLSGDTSCAYPTLFSPTTATLPPVNASLTSCDRFCIDT